VIAAKPADPDREIISQYHAAGAVYGAYMLRHGRWKLIHYEGFKPELFDLENDPEELKDLAGDKFHQDILAELLEMILDHLDPAATDAQAFADQAALIESYGGREAALKLGAPGATPPPKVA
jgi:choline-sulfatase